MEVAIHKQMEKLIEDPGADTETQGNRTPPTAENLGPCGDTRIRLGEYWEWGNWSSIGKK